MKVRSPLTTTTKVHTVLRRYPTIELLLRSATAAGVKPLYPEAKDTAAVVVVAGTRNTEKKALNTIKAGHLFKINSRRREEQEEEEEEAVAAMGGETIVDRTRTLPPQPKRAGAEEVLETRKKMKSRLVSQAEAEAGVGGVEVATRRN